MTEISRQLPKGELDMLRPTNPSLFDTLMMLLIVSAMIAIIIMFATGVLPR